MTAISLRRDEGVALAIALAAHVALVAVLAMRPAAPPFPLPERMTVTLSEDAALTSISPDPQAQAAPDQAPELGEPAPPAEPLPVVRPEPRPQPTPPPPVARAIPRPEPKPPVAKAPPPKAPPPKLAPAKAVPKAAPKAGATQPLTPPRNPVRPGASRIGDDFLKGTPGAAAKGQASAPPAATIGPAVRSALSGAIARQLKPHWKIPQGADAELLVTVLTWDLNADGTLAGAPRVVRQEGITDANRAQAARHAEQAIRAVRLAAPFSLPAEFYPAWKRIATFRFDRKLSQ